ncbi:MAG: NAD(P)H-dependent oxidoreductase [Bacteroidaceae bacterium]|nr:NAD(P)H-dependent oxidoreductase [Bacteroidaceae bacterium]
MANVAKEIIGTRAEVQELDYGDLPLLNQDIEQPEPASVARIRKEIAQADALWIFTPEYNMSYPGHLKNLLDWLSRPVKFMDYGTPTCINGKPIAICGAGGKAAKAVKPKVLFPYHYGQTDVTIIPSELKECGIDVRIRHYE